MKKIIPLLLALLLPACAMSTASAANLPPWTGQCPSGTAAAAIGCQPAAATPLPTDLVLGWEIGQTPNHTVAMQVQQLAGSLSGTFLLLTGGTLTGPLVINSTLQVVNLADFVAGAVVGLPHVQNGVVDFESLAGGLVAVVAPSTVSTFTLTLPAETGTLATLADIATALPSATTSQFYGGSGAAGVAHVLTQAQATALINPFSSTLSGAAPASGGGTTNYLRADGTWDAPAGSGAVSSVSVAVPAASILGQSGSPITNSGTITITTTGTSGGIPYFSDGSTLSTSAALGANLAVFGGGPGVAPHTVQGVSATAGTPGLLQLGVSSASEPGIVQMFGSGSGSASLSVQGVADSSLLLLPNAGGTATLDAGAVSPIVQDSQGRVTCPTCGTGSGTVTSVTAGAGLTTTKGSTGGSITTAGTVYEVRAINAQTGTTYAIADANQGLLTTFSNAAAVAVSLPQAGAGSNFLTGWFAHYQNVGTGLVTITPTTSVINGIATFQLQSGQSATITSDGTNYRAFVGSPLNVLANNALSTRIPGFPTAALGGNARGQFSIDIQPYGVSGQTAAEAATGLNSVTVGLLATASNNESLAVGYAATATGQFASAVGGDNTASATNTVAMGFNNTSNQANAVSFGASNTAQGANATSIGSSNNVDVQFGAAVGYFNNLLGSGTAGGAFGYDNYVFGTNTYIMGFQGTDRNNIGASIHSTVNLGGSSSSAPNFLGRSQDETYTLVNSTSGATAVRLTTDGLTAAAHNVAALATDVVQLFTIELTITDTTTNAVWSYTLGPSLIQFTTNAASTTMSGGNPAFVAGPTLGSPSALAAAPTVIADTTNGGYNLSYTPPVGNTDVLYAVGRLHILNTRYN